MQGSRPFFQGANKSFQPHRLESERTRNNLHQRIYYVIKWLEIHLTFHRLGMYARVCVCIRTCVLAYNCARVCARVLRKNILYTITIETTFEIIYFFATSHSWPKPGFRIGSRAHCLRFSCIAARFAIERAALALPSAPNGLPAL